MNDTNAKSLKTNKVSLVSLVSYIYICGGSDTPHIY